MNEIVLATLNARWAHASFGLRYLMANLGDMRSRAVIREFDINRRPMDVAEDILAHHPRIVGLGVYIWNAAPSLELVSILKRAAPDVLLILGGPEVSFEADQQEICRLADFVITGEADLAFADLCQTLLAGGRPDTKIIAAGLPLFAPPASAVVASEQRCIALPYALYLDEDLENRVVYVEASRGCPFACEFCLSSLDIPVRAVPLDAFLAAMRDLLDRGCRRFKFVDRTFNLNIKTSSAILQFFLDRYRPGLFLHFEMIPDRLPDALRELIVRFPPGALQFEVGVQSFNEDVTARISRRQDNVKVEENLRFLKSGTQVHVHADLIVGLPGESVDSFAAGFDRLLGLGVQEIQVGILKRLRGAPIPRHDRQWNVIWSAHPPYEILSNSLIDFAAMQRLRRFARYWDLLGNSGNFSSSLPLIWNDQSPFATFMDLSMWLHNRAGQSHAIALNRLAELLHEYLTVVTGIPAEEAAHAIWSDYLNAGRREGPEFLRSILASRDPSQRGGDRSTEPAAAGSAPQAPLRQARHIRRPAG